MKLWPMNMKEDRVRLNSAIKVDNIKRKSNYQRLVKLVSQSQYIVYHALMIEASRYVE